MKILQFFLSKCLRAFLFIWLCNLSHFNCSLNSVYIPSASRASCNAKPFNSCKHSHEVRCALSISFPFLPLQKFPLTTMAISTPNCLTFFLFHHKFLLLGSIPFFAVLRSKRPLNFK